MIYAHIREAMFCILSQFSSFSSDTGQRGHEAKGAFYHLEVHIYVASCACVCARARMRVSSDSPVRLNPFHADKVYAIFSRGQSIHNTHTIRKTFPASTLHSTHTHAHHAYLLNAHT